MTKIIQTTIRKIILKENMKSNNNTDHSGLDLTVILPTLNEEGNIARLIIEIFELLPLCQIIVVDDNSTDNTVQEIEEVKNLYPNLILIQKINNRCLTESIQMGINASKTEFIAWMDADHSHPPEILHSLFALAKCKKVAAIASRYKDSSSISNTTGSFSAKILSWILNLFIYNFLKLKVTDYTSGFIVLPRDIFLNYKLIGDYGEYFIHLVHNISKTIEIEEIQYKSPSRTHGESKTGRNICDLTVRGLKYIRITINLTFHEYQKRNSRDTSSVSKD